VVRDDRGEFIEVEGIRVHCLSFGDGEAVIALHGGGPGSSGLSNYRRNVDALAQQFRIVVPDLPGFGWSDNPEVGDRPLQFYARTVVATMDSLGIERAHVIGNSLGGGIAMTIARDYPDRAGRLVLMGAAGAFSIFTPRGKLGLFQQYYKDGVPDRARLRTWLEAMVFDPSSITDELLEERYEISIRPEIMAAPKMLPWLELARDELWTSLDQISNQTMVVWGRDDRAGFDSGIFLIQRLPNADLVVLSRCGHWVQWERPDEFNALATTFLGGSAPERV